MFLFQAYRQIGVSVATLAALFFSAVLLGESLGFLQLIGAVLILGGAAFGELFQQKRLLEVASDRLVSRDSGLTKRASDWREKERPLIHIKHNSTEPNLPLRPELPGNAFKDAVRPLPGEKQFSKTGISSFFL